MTENGAVFKTAQNTFNIKWRTILKWAMQAELLYILFFLLMMTKHVNRHRDDDVHSEILHFINVLNLFYKFFNINTKH